MVIMTEQTPKPASLKFLPGGLLMGNSTAYLPSEAAAARSPLARRRFEIDGVSEGFFGSDVMAVTRTRDLDWRLHKPPILGAIMDSVASGAPLLPEGTDRSSSACAEHEDSAGEDGGGQDDGIVTRSKDLLDTRLRPVVARDADDILFRGFDRGIVVLHSQGSCSGCPGSTATLKAGIEIMLRHQTPEVVEVRSAY